MRFSRKQSIVASVAILFLFFLGVALLRPQSKNTIPTDSLQPSEPQESPQLHATSDSGVAASNSAPLGSGPDFILDNFKREEVKAGKKIWEVKASRGRYNPSAGRAMLENAEMLLHQKGGGIVSLKANNANLTLEGSEGLSAAEFSGNVVIVQDNKTTLETELATYDKAKDTIVAPDFVKVSGDKMYLEGIGMEVLVTSKDIRLLKQTKTIIESKEPSETATN